MRLFSRDQAPSADPDFDKADTGESLTGLVRIGLLAIGAAMCVALTGSLFRLSVQHGFREMAGLYAWMRHVGGVGGFLLVWMTASVITIASMWLVRRFMPSAAGSGIQRIEAVWRNELPIERDWKFLPVKFVSGVLALSSGYALGREGPVVQMGAYIGGVFGRHHWASEQDRRILVASLAGAGLAVAFSAPLGGLLFALEELTHVARTRLVTISMIACAVAVPVTQFILGPQPVFQVPALAEPSLYVLPFYVLLGVLTGFAGVLYNSAILGGLSLFMWLDMVPFWLRGAACAAVLALLVWFVPEFAGGGEQLVQQLLSGPWLLATLCLLWLVRLGLGPMSYSMGMSGGLFAPMLAMGAVQGALFCAAMTWWLPGIGLDWRICTIVGMGAMFASSVRAPLTGIVLILEMTATGRLVVPMLLACLPAAIIPFWLGQLPIYDALRLRLLAARSPVATGVDK